MVAAEVELLAGQGDEGGNLLGGEPELEAGAVGQGQHTRGGLTAPDRMHPDATIAVQAGDEPADGGEQAVSVVERNRRPDQYERKVDHGHGVNSVVEIGENVVWRLPRRGLLLVGRRDAPLPVGTQQRRVAATRPVRELRNRASTIRPTARLPADARR